MRLARFAILFLLWSGAAAADPKLVPFHPSGIYKVGERVGWTLQADGAAAVEHTYVVKKNNFTELKTGTLAAREGSTIEVVLDEPAMVYVEVTPKTPGAKVIALGAAVAPHLLTPSAPEPRDFDSFWAAKIRELERIAPEPQLTAKPSDKPDVEYFTFQMKHIDGRTIHGQLAKPKRPGKFPGLVIYQWASPPYPLEKQWVTDRAAEGWLAVNIEPHDVLPDAPPEYYEALPQELKEYEQIGRDDRDESYFLQMYLADYRAVEYLASRPDWDGKTLVVTGTSMGGQQALCAAALNEKVTGLVVHVPAGADSNGPLRGRASGYPWWNTQDPKILQASLYFDTVNCARRIRVPSLISMGFLDTITPPAGIFVAYNQIRGYKEAVPLVDAPHNHVATEEQQAPYLRRSAQWLQTFRAGANVAHPADVPEPRRDENSKIAHQELMAKRTQGKIDVYFLGDSITRRWGASDPQYAHLLANWRANFFGWNAANFGWGADKTQHILWRLHAGELDGVHPKIIVLMAGTNNVGDLTPVGNSDQRAAEVARGIEAIVKLCREKAPNATIVLTAITPRNDNIAVMPIIDAANAKLARLADGKRVRFINLNDQLADAQGRLFPGVTDPDQLHLAVKGYQIWADALKPIFTEILGPPAAKDVAPPPTGDPSVRR